MHGRELVDVDGDSAAAPLTVAWTRDPEACRVCEGNQKVRLPERVRADPLDSDLLDQVVAGGPGVERRDVRRARQETRCAGRVAHLFLEGERQLVCLPACVGRLEPLCEIRADVQPAVARAPAEPLDRAAHREVDIQDRHVERDNSRGLVGVENDVSAGFVCALDDPPDVLDLPRLEEYVADRD